MFTEYQKVLGSRLKILEKWPFLDKYVHQNMSLPRIVNYVNPGHIRLGSKKGRARIEIKSRILDNVVRDL